MYNPQKYQIQMKQFFWVKYFRRIDFRFVLFLLHKNSSHSKSLRITKIKDREKLNRKNKVKYYVL